MIDKINITDKSTYTFLSNGFIYAYSNDDSNQSARIIIGIYDSKDNYLFGLESKYGIISNSYIKKGFKYKLHAKESDKCFCYFIMI